MDYDTDETEDLTIVEIQGRNIPPGLRAGISASGDVYLRGDIHPLGAATALIAAAGQHIPYVALSAVSVLFPADWLRGECAHDMDRLRVIDNMERLVRGART